MNSTGNKHISAALSLILLGCISACSEPEYWIEGFTLPPDSVVVSRKITTTETPPDLVSIFANDETDELTIGFNNKRDWDYVTSHFDEQFDEGDWDDAPLYTALDEWLKFTEDTKEFFREIRTYTSDKLGILIAVSNNSLFPDDEGEFVLTDSQYTLCIVRDR